MNNNLKRLGIAITAFTVISGSAVGIVAAQNGNGGMPNQGQMFRENRPFLGVTLEDVEGGVRVVNVVEGSPAETAGLQADDLIVSINGASTNDSQAVRDAILPLNIGDTITLEVQRGEETISLDVVLGENMLNNRPGLFIEQGDMAVTYNPEDQTWTVRRLSEDSELYTAGVRADDVITAIDGAAYDPAGVGEYLDSLAEDATVTLNITRGEETLDVTVPAASLDLVRVPFGAMGRGGFNGGMFNFGDGGMRFGMGGSGRLGLVFTPIDADVAAENSLTVTEGALVAEVMEGSPAAEAGLLAGDVITAVNGESITEEITLRDRIAAYEAGDEVTLDVLRDGETAQITVTLGEPDTFFQMMPGMGGMMPEGMFPGMMMPGHGGMFGGRDGMFGGQNQQGMPGQQNQQNPQGQQNQGGANL